jgi:glycosyltransferase involved in cell wall biosynthesis
MERIKNNSSVRYLGYHPFDEVKKILARARYGFVLYSEVKYMENIPAKMYEYLAGEVIPIFSSFESFKYEVEAEGWGIGVNPKDTEEAAQKIYEVMMDAKKRAVIDENIKRYKPVYGWESEKKELLGCYARISEFL